MSLSVVRADGLVTIQDLGRPGYAHLGVPRAGALDPEAASLANRLVGNGPDAAVLEVTVAGLTVRSRDARTIAVTGARCAVRVDGRARATYEPVSVRAGGEIEVGPAAAGVRSYLAISGGIAVPAVLGSRSTDTLAWVGPPRVRAGENLPVGPSATPSAVPDVVVPAPPSGVLRIDPGPRVDWFAESVLADLCAAPYVVGADSNRIGLRLEGRTLRRLVMKELSSEGMVLGAVQVPPSGLPVVFLADHPTTGGYPVVAVVRRDDLGQCAQLRPGDGIRFRSDR